MDATLKEAAQAGDTNKLYNCIRDNADVLRRIDEADFVDTPLHIAAARGHTDFVMALMYLKPSLARKLNQDIFSPMHLALLNDHKETVLRLLAVDKDLVRVKGKEGYTPLHHVVREGNLGLLVPFLNDCPACVEDVTIKNETALHIAAQNDRFEALEILALWIRRTDIHSKASRKHVLDLKDGDGNTVLHIASSKTQPKMIELLLECDVDTKETNMIGSTAFKILENQSRSYDRERSLEILRYFDRRRSLRIKAGLKPRDESLEKTLRSKVTWLEIAISSFFNLADETISALLVVVVLILTASYEAMLTPPVGVLIGDISGKDTIAKVGTTAKDKFYFDLFVNVNFMVFFYALLVTVALLQIAFSDSGSFLIQIIEFLSSSLLSSLAILAQVMLPSTPPKFLARESVLVDKFMPFLIAIGAFVLMEMFRVLSRMTFRRIKCFKKILREL